MNDFLVLEVGHGVCDLPGPGGHVTLVQLCPFFLDKSRQLPVLGKIRQHPRRVELYFFCVRLFWFTIVNLRVVFNIQWDIYKVTDL